MNREAMFRTMVVSAFALVVFAIAGVVLLLQGRSPHEQELYQMGYDYASGLLGSVDVSESEVGRSCAALIRRERVTGDDRDHVYDGCYAAYDDQR